MFGKVLQKPFTKASLKQYGIALASGVTILPLFVALQINQQVHNFSIFLGGLALYFVIFMLVGWRFEAWRMKVVGLMKSSESPVPKMGRVFGYAWLALITNTLPSLLVVVWVVTLIRNIIFYPPANWGHAYPDKAWGGPTWEGAIALHTGSAIISIFVIPWFLQWILQSQSKLIRGMGKKKV